MILKRLLVTALGALGLGALAAGPATAQQIPAPDAYGDSLACQNGIPVIKAKAMKDHPLDSGIEGGALSDAQVASLTAMARACADDPVGDGIAKARELHQTYVRAEDTRDEAQKAYDANPTTLNKGDLDDAKDAYDEAKKARDDYAGMGEVYKAVFDEEARRTAATDAHTQWMKDYKAEQDAATAKNGVQYANYLEQFAGFDSNGQALEFVNTRLQTTWDNPDTADDETAYTTYVQVRDQSGDIIAPTKQQDGTYVVPTRLAGVDASNPDGTDGQQDLTFEILEYNHDNDATTPVQQVLRLSDSNAGVIRSDNQTFGATGGIDADTKASKKALKDATDLLAANKDGTQTAPLTEAKRKAQARYDFFKAQSDEAYGDLRRGKLSNPTGDDPLTPDVDESTTSTTGFKYTARHYEAFSRAESTEAAAAKALKAAYDARVAASKAVEDEQRDTAAYLGQLVQLRKYEQAVADNAAKDADDDDKNDDGKTAQQVEADKNLKTAQAQLDAFDAVEALGDDHPVNKLVKSLLAAKDSDADDDGQALVDAVSSTYDTAKNAKDTADGVASDVAGLTGEGGAVAMNTAAIEQNESDITALDGRVTVNEGAIATNATNIMANADNIAANATNIMTNTDNIMANSGRIDTNAADIMTNAGHIADNTAAIGMNTGAIADLGNRVGSNESAIQRNSGMIGELSESLETVRAGVAASMALAGMPAINGRGVSIGIGSFDGESAFAVGFMIQGEMASFKVGVTSAGGATGASAGVGFQF